jgi:mRNA interferase MazF
MKLKQYDIWLADLNARMGTEPCKTRPVVIIQTDLLNEVHPSTMICPVTSNINPDVQLLRMHLDCDQLDKPSDVLVDHIRAIDNSRLIQKIGVLNDDQIRTLKRNIRILLDI